jgi:hypothetical protein
MWLIAWEDFSIFVHHESFKSYILYGNVCKVAVHFKLYMYLFCYLYLQVIVDQPEQPSTDQQHPGTSQQSASMDMAAADNSTPEEEGWREWELIKVMVSTEH